VHGQILEASLDPLRGFWTGLVGWGAFLAGETKSAMAWLEEGSAICQRFMVAGGHLVAVEGLIAQAASVRGDLSRAEAALAACRRAMVSPAAEGPWIDLSEAWVRWARGQGDGSAAALRAGERWRAAGYLSMEAWGLHEAARLGDLSGAARLAQLGRTCEGDLIPQLSAHVQALGRADAAALEEASQGFERMGLLLLAAEAAAEAAEAHRRAGRAGRARAPLLRSAALAAQCEGSRSPVLDRAALGSALTDRELQVARLAARGTSSPGIALQLGLSVRTVENHLQQAYAKLGVRSRAELAALLGQPAPAAVH
jgi:DNA-binding CsgD family transcriptional regulator